MGVGGRVARDPAVGTPGFEMRGGGGGIGGGKGESACAQGEKGHRG